MKIRCKNCYRVLNQNEEYCTSCGEHSAQMQKAMITGDYGPDPVGKFKQGFGIFVLAGFLLCGVLQVLFAVMQTKEIDGYTQIFCQANSVFFSSLLVFLLIILFFYKDIKVMKFESTKEQWLGGLAVGVMAIVVCVLLSMLFDITQVLPGFVVDYLESGNVKFFDLKSECLFKIYVGCILSTISIEYIGRKCIVDALDDATMLGDKAIFIISSFVVTAMEVAWTMSLDVLIVTLIINMVTTGIYMYTNRNVLLNIIIRILLITITIIVFLG